MMKLIVGLGNPGDRYQNTLHNVGFLALDALSSSLSTDRWLNRFKGLISRGSYQGSGFILLKPQTFMNVSGESVLACQQFFKIPTSDILVISDDVDRPAGLLRYRASGGHGGHNGLRNIIQLCGDNHFHRIKIGIGRPNGKQGVSDYVLSKPSQKVAVLIDDAIQQTVGYQKDFIQNKTIQIQPTESG
ncbi:MAG: aminoacyl-tRNA hydrolase [Deltaproteobacteria bacterium]|jgi:peptidyl-tRNA hydrolase, PTH1 family|nr:aminoacyl-tRNA hydrolase [Deltaproteobacteria bacterium]MBT4089229.1 aminoacyl-tRNA hydrolase [Deltaproteobacteria bacterium]MBT4269318.1 aminoacyl-tRNA hydrolase [Deltaproteobacteria bacterium]MBT4643244.1 aminoacyl-tRNA hydrolase [Deltaproteobacteria bacterium]MBT6498529.1 aminoacyl-tRNA hydrolase [Deltaproteobacteria bacterium]